jgi:hypothetical protein
MRSMAAGAASVESAESMPPAPWVARARTGSPWGTLAFGDATAALSISRAHLVIFLIVIA